MQYRVCELFAGVGGFRLALEREGWDVVFSNQWEPATRLQHASVCYVRHFGAAGHSNEDINQVTGRLERADDPSEVIPEHDLLVGGFPCQDYSVATTRAKGIEGKKGVLWWAIHKVLTRSRPKFVLLENVDRLLVSPAKQRGRDMGMILACLRQNGYCVEWRVLNAADYGFPQKRRRVFLFAAHLSTEMGKEWNSLDLGGLSERVCETGLFATEFPVIKDYGSLLPIPVEIPQDLVEVTKKFAMRFYNAGTMTPSGGVITYQLKPEPGLSATLGSILQKGVGPEYFVDQKKLWSAGAGKDSWEYAKGAKREDRETRAGFKYFYTEGAIPFPDHLDQPSRTLLTGEGNKRPNRASHLIKDPQAGRYRVLTPVEAERLNGFGDGWTEGMPLGKRYFCMGNALVVGLVQRVGRRIKLMVQGEQGEKRARKAA